MFSAWKCSLTCENFVYKFGKEIKQLLLLLLFSLIKEFIKRAYLIFWVDLFQLSFQKR